MKQKLQLVLLGILTSLGFVISGFSGKEKPQHCITLLYDQSSIIADSEKIALAQLNSLIKELSSWPIQEVQFRHYGLGESNKCRLSVLLSRSESEQIPRSILKEIESSDKYFIWIGYNLWQLGERIENRLGLKEVGVNRGSIEVVPLRYNQIEILAEKQRPGSQEIVPFIVKDKNFIYVAEKPSLFFVSSISKVTLLHLFKMAAL